ncbi:MAG: site-specific integrase [Thermoguttaceae bacterium]
MARNSHPWFRRSDGWWYIKIAGRQWKLARGRRNKAEAVRRWHELTLERAANPPTDSAEQTVASVIDVFLTHSKRLYVPQSYANRCHYLQLFAEAHGFRLIRDCLPMHLTAWLDGRAGWVSDWTRSNVVRIIQRAFNWAAQQGIIKANPFRGVAQRPGEARRPMTDQEFRALLRATGPKRPTGRKQAKRRHRPTAGERFRQVLFFLRYTGARPGEMASLTWEDVNLEAGVIVLRKHKTIRTQRTPRPRVILLVPAVVKLLRRVRQQQSPGAKRVFLTARATPWDRWNLGHRMRRLRDRADLPDDVKLYGLRHRFGTQSVVNGVDIKTLAELMGHTTSRMTEHYVHLAGCQRHLAAAMLQAVGQRPGS